MAAWEGDRLDENNGFRIEQGQQASIVIDSLKACDVSESLKNIVVLIMSLKSLNSIAFLKK